MSNHYHLLVETPTPNLSKGMQLLNDVYTQRLNRTAKRSDHVYRGRFKSILVNKDTYLLELARYVVLNPARANMVRSVRDWKWSSYRATAGQEASLSFLTVEWLLSRFSANPSEAVTPYRRFVQQDQEVAIWQELRGGILLGANRFVQELTSRLHEIENQREIPRSQRLAAKPSLDDLFSDITSNAHRSKKIHEATRRHEVTLTQLQEHLRLHYSTISRIASRIEAGRKSRDKI